MHRLRPVLAVVAIAAAFVLAGGYVHLREWLDTYRHVPAGVDGRFVVRIGFPVHVAASVLLAGSLVVVVVLRRQRLASLVIAATAAFEVGAIVLLVWSRTGSVLGWSEPTWSGGARQALVVAIGSLLTLGALAAVRRAAPARARARAT